MKRLSPQQLLGISVAVLVIMIAAEGVWLCREYQTARRAQAALNQKLQEREWLAAQTPALGEENEEAISADLERARQALADAKAGLRRGETGRWVEPAPAQTLEAYFNIASFVERSRTAANAAQVVLRPDERFGFAAFAHEGPAVELLPLVHRQLLVGETLTGQLIESHPRALLAMRRETAGPGEAAAKNQAEDYFVMDRALSVRRLGEVETVAFRVEFSGQTVTLRNFLTALAALPQPFLVRSVEVEPLPVPMAAVSPVADAPAAPAPMVRQNLSQFAVIVESVLLAEAPAKTAP
jgi:hypothetical protein